MGFVMRKLVDLKRHQGRGRLGYRKSNFDFLKAVGGPDGASASAAGLGCVTQESASRSALQGTGILPRLSARSQGTSFTESCARRAPERLLLCSTPDAFKGGGCSSRFLLFFPRGEMDAGVLSPSGSIWWRLSTGTSASRGAAVVLACPSLSVTHISSLLHPPPLPGQHCQGEEGDSV